MKTIKVWGVLALSAAVLPLVGSCSKDDAPERPSSAEVSDIDGTRVTSVGDCRIRYDENGRPYRFKDNYSEIEIDYEKNKILFEDEKMDVKFNGKGFITEISASWDYSENDDYRSRGEDENYHYKGSGKITFSYDKNNCLVSLKSKSSETETDLSNNHKNHYSYEETQNFNWSKGNLKSIVYDATEEEDGDKEYYKANIDIDYGFEENKFKQFPMTFLYEFEGAYEIFFAVGLFGNGPVDLPDHIDIVEEDDYSISSDITFTLNENESISTESSRLGNYTYGYSKITRSELNIGQPVIKAKSIRNFFVNSKRQK